MGCAQGKYTVNSPPRRLEKLKMENGYVGKEAFVDHRRSTGQKLSGRINKSDPPLKNSSGGLGSSGDGGGGGGEKRLSDRDGGRDGSGSGSGGGGKGSLKERVSTGGDKEQLVDGWPKWFIDNVPKEVLAKCLPKSAENYEKIDKVGQGTYSNVYKARDRDTGKLVALKKVKFDTSEPVSVKFMAREIMILQKLDHPNVVKLEGIATSRMQYSLYLVFDFMWSDLATIIYRPEERLAEPQIKCYMHQLLSGLQHCHDRGILHRDIKGSNLLIDRNGMLQIADFGLANFYSPRNKHPLTSRVVTLWYRAPELLLGSTDYGVGIDLWSAGCLMAEMFAGRPLMPGRTEVEQLHRIFKLCGTPPDDYWKKLRLATTFRPPQSYNPSFFVTFREFPESSLGLLTTLLNLDPMKRGSASVALQDDFFQTNPLACDLSGLPAIQIGEDELNQAYELRRRRSSKLKQRSRTQGERKGKDLVAVENPDKDSLVPEEVPSEELEKTAVAEVEPTSIQVHEPSSSTSSNSSGKARRQVESPPNCLISPVPSSSNKKMSPRSQDHPNTGSIINNLPPLPFPKKGSSNYNGDIYRFNQVHRSASTREFRKLIPRKHLEQLYAVDD